ncbi:urea ABC transporter permease subunit UrtB [Yersinia mollaretii]|uniref:Branched-chain amino acid transport system, permease component n=1 Tax=Yersinia mollaretii (strain ATCC 43969 / DSM 18520 / CIP 103324 / CNY 7263 / WAIP 204) TaxID=349967 RepID=A0ABM9Y5N5_YERMW|nr:urea ABC transporter permease subunit UrtB [Yersinia mollaretii]EEQ09072.1 Branched-chain amino acid transport system, permease component [Yersinia mollaretii ATCC 43969]MDN0111701.1 urea ABC transporter permease subunit UrtB [Yersinia mollaretii]QKJ03744.1 urea ABC transporter permease subunit UrtB [Yersinia mollaretii ATCC 43969]
MKSLIPVWGRAANYALRLLIGLLWGISTWTVAGPAHDFAVANRSQQATLLQQWATEPDASRLPLLQALKQETLVMDSTGQVFVQSHQGFTPLEGQLQPSDTPKKIWLNNRLRILIANALAAQRLVSEDASVRLQAALALQQQAKSEQLPLLNHRLTLETDSKVKDALSIALANLQLADSNPQVRLNAVQLLGQSGSPQTQSRLQNLTDAKVEPDVQVRAAAATSLKQVQNRLLISDVIGQVFSGLSLGSILLLAALGLAITYGLLGVINMAHGEMLMLGAYSAYWVQSLFQQFAPHWLALYPLVALPVAFFITAGIGMALERTVIRHLYGRPLETLLATWGISLMLIQSVRMIFGAQNLEVANPGWLSGGLQILPNLILPWNRIAVIAFVVIVLLFTWLLLNKTRLGLQVRAVTQNRAMAACCGVATGRVDMLAFGLGSGIAGLGGVALSQLGNVGPELGQGYIIDSFLVVVLGGVGQLAGSVVAALGLGMLNKILEPQMGAVLGKILILVLIILFIQKRPQGLFALKGRVSD